jgi:Lanthionine synthetase C-like protein
MLFQANRHEPVLDAPWSEAHARATIGDIVADLEQALGSDIGWPDHPLDGVDGPTLRKSLYFGSSGALAAMSFLEREGIVSLRIRPADLIKRIYDSYLLEPDTGSVVPSYFLGEVGILLLLWRLTGSGEAAERLATLIRANESNPANEALWGAPGTAVGALHMYSWTEDPRWRELFLENAEQIWATWLPSEAAHYHIWTQNLWGRTHQMLGAGHGFAGNVYPLLRGAALLPEPQRDLLYDRCLETLRATAVIDGAAANWPANVRDSAPIDQDMLMQWCHGAPGMVTGLADFPHQRSADLEQLLIMAGNAVWSAGPLTKGYGLCHGTAGNGYAFLKLYQRTGSTLWLERARAFAMHAMNQYDRIRREYGRGRYTLWTGDPGLAVFVWDCITGSSRMPGLDQLG